MISTTLNEQLSQFCNKYDQPIDKLTYLLNNQIAFKKQLTSEDSTLFEDLLTNHQSELLVYFALFDDEITVKQSLNHPDYRLVTKIYPDHQTSRVDVSIEHIKSRELFSLAYIDTYQENDELVSGYLYDPTNDDDYNQKISVDVENLTPLIESNDALNPVVLPQTTEQLTPSFAYYHIYDYDRDQGLHTEKQLRYYAHDQQEYLPSVLNREDDKVLLAELMAIDPLIDHLDQVVRILEERGFDVDAYHADTLEELLAQIDRIFNR